jgi:hypothetical protein
LFTEEKLGYGYGGEEGTNTFLYLKGMLGSESGGGI